MTNEERAAIERVMASIPDTDKLTHGNRVVFELKFDEIRAIRAALEPQQAAVDLEALKQKVFSETSIRHDAGSPYEAICQTIDYLHAQGLLKGGEC